MKRLLQFSIAFIIGFSANAQNGNSSSPILLTNHRVASENFADQAQPKEIVDGKIYRIVNDAQLKLGQQYGPVEVLEYLPKKAFLISIESNEIKAAKRILVQKGATALLQVQPDWKLSKKLYTQDIPEWAWLDDNRFKLWVRYYSDLQHNSINRKLAQAGYRIIDQKSDQNLIALAITPDEVQKVAELPYLIHLQEMEDPGHPENYTARTNHRVNTLQSDYPGAVYYDGTGVTVGHGDDGAIHNHVDFTGRLTQSSPPSNGDHGDHVAGTIFGAGNKHPRAEGMAPGANLYYQDYPDNLNNVDSDFNTQNVRITSSSYSNGCNAGYTNFTQQMDQDAIDNPELIHVFSAGNNGNSNCGYGAGSGWGNVTGGHKIAKNVIAVANLTLVDGLASSSSRGPASDGRIKPDIGAVGTQVFSTTDQPVPHSYTQKTGTSMACPGVSGVLATLYQAYRDNNNGQDPHGGLLKAIALNTAKDLGNPGPDFRYGYGRINARRAHEVIKKGNFISDNISSGTKTHTITVPSGNVDEVRIMLYWPDLPGSTIASRALVNDLDLDVSQGGTSYDPWVLDPTPNATTLNDNAVRARDSLNNMEQVTFSNPGSGNITVDVSAFNIPSGNQDYFVIYEFVMDEVVLTYPLGGEGFVPTQTEYLRWDATDGPGSFSVEYSTDAGTTWSTINNSVSSSNRHLNWTVPNTPTDQAKVRVIRGQDTSETPGTFVIVPHPFNFGVASNCPDSVTLSWDPTSSASGYNVYRLGTKYMDSIGYTTDTFMVVNQSNPLVDDWYSVASVINGKAGQRAIAIQKPNSVVNCQLTEDLLMADLVSPIPGVSTTCFNTSGLPVKVRLTNLGLNDVYDFEVSYSFNGGPVVTDTVSDTINPNNSLVYTFNSSSLTLQPGNTYSMDLWLNYGVDQNQYNDTLNESIMVISGSVKNLPYFNDFESFNLCGTMSNCGGTNCNLTDGWINLNNGQVDDIDFRTNAGATPSNATGPIVDFDPGTGSGQYVYLEASAGCDSSQAIMLSPCLLVDTAANMPMVEFAYHMFGTDIGRLNIDLITENGVVSNVINEKIGSQGNIWQTEQIDLSAYSGQHVIVRFRGKTGFGFRSDIAIDGFKFFDNGINAPVADITISNTSPCTQDTVTFQNASTGVVSSYQWDFGPGATPSTATTVGPHKVVYAFGGSKQVSLKVNNAGGLNEKINSFTVLDQPGTAFSYAIANNKVTFTDVSSFNPNSWQWNFGDGDTSNVQNPVHTYNAVGTYGVVLTATNTCGSSTYLDSITITSIDLPENSLENIQLFPNPTQGVVNINLPGELLKSSIRITDVSGRQIRNIASDKIKPEMTLDLTDLPRGIYFVEIQNEKRGEKSFRVIKQ